MDSIIKAVSEAMPHYNKFLLKDFTKKEINGSIEFISVVFSEAVKQFDGLIKYKKYKILSPEERIEFELRPKQDSGVRIAVSELSLVDFVFEFEGREFHTHLYLPYSKNDAIVIKNTRYMIQRTIVEKVFSKTNEGIAARVIRSPIRFGRTKIFRVVSAVDERTDHGLIITADIHRRKRLNKKNTPNTTILHYLLCKFGYLGTLARFGFNPEDFKFVPNIGETIDYDYFVARKKQKSPELYLRIKRSSLEDPNHMKFVTNLLYLLTAYDRHNIQSLYEKTGAIYRIYMGRITHGDTHTETQYKSHADTHIASLDTYLDPITRDRLIRFGVQVDDIYDLLQYVFFEIDRIHTNATHSNLYYKRIDIMHGILIQTIGSRIFEKFYNARRDQKKLTDKDVTSILQFSPMLIQNIYKARNVTSEVSAYGDNWLTSFGISKTRQSGLNQQRLTPQAPEHRFHPSIAVVETLISFSGQNPGISGAINPFLQITDDGDIDIDNMPYHTDIDPLIEVLPYKE